ncbi:MAG: GNAT family N-acetyltransferase [Prochloraceae cyanobacterium]
MIRSIEPDDKNELIALANKIGLFEDNELEELRKILADYFLNDNDRDRFWLVDEDRGVVGVAYCELEPMTDSTWNLRLIAIDPDCQGKGKGTLLLRYVEQKSIELGGRMLLVETSSLDSFDRTRAFYRKCGYQEEARIREFYKVGNDKIVYRKVLIDRDSINVNYLI